MSSSRAAFLLVAVASLLAAPAGARPSRPPADAATCADAALTNAARAVSSGLRCQAAAAARGRRAPRACARALLKKFSRALRKVDGRGTCLLDPSNVLVLAGAQAIVEEMVDRLRPERRRSRCAAAKLKAAGVAGERFMLARARARRDYDMPALGNELAAATGAFEGAFAAAESGTDCQTFSDFVDTRYVLLVGAGLAGPLSTVVVTTKSIQFPEPARQDVIDNRGGLEAQGLTVADDGSTVSGDPKPAGGWIAQLGDLRARVDPTGLLQLDVPAGSPLEGALFHPSNRDVPVARFFLVELGGVVDVPPAIQLDIVTQGACKMDIDPADDPPSCHAGALPAGIGQAASFEANALNPDPAQFPPQVNGPLGTYANPDPAAEQVACLDYDGFIQTGERGDSSIRGAISYPGSTCQKKVDEGCCENEAATVRRRILSLVDEFSFPVLGCVANHKGRYCQQITKGDVAAEAKGQIALAGQSISVEVRGGENVAVQVHNNACYGQTFVSPGLFNSLGGSLVGDRFDGETLFHFDQTAYYFDSPLTYFTPLDCQTGQEDEFEFQADDSEAEVTFVCVTTTTTTLPCQPGFDFSCPNVSAKTTTTLP